MAHTITPTINTDVQMGDVVIVRGSEYTIMDEPSYVKANGYTMIEWELEPVPAGLKTGLLKGAFCVWSTETTNVVS